MLEKNVDKVGYVNDQWVLVDKLGMGRAGDTLARMVLEVTPPFTVGVTGKWGSGKTSVLRRAFATLGGLPVKQSLRMGDDKAELDEKEFTNLGHHLLERAEILKNNGWSLNHHLAANRTLCVWYSPWQHQNEDNPLIPLLLEIHAQYSGKRKLKEFANLSPDELRRGGLAALSLLEHAIDAAYSIEMGKPAKLMSGMTERAFNALGESHLSRVTKISDGQRFHLLFEDAVDNLLADLKANFEKEESNIITTLKKIFTGQTEDDTIETRLIIFIDDLDRCEEKTVVGLLEAIKLYLGTRRCVFVLGVDDKAVADALKRHWQGRDEDYNREYLEKLFQATLPVPLPRENDLRSLIENQLKQHEFPEETCPSLAEDITNLLEPNPRKVKNFLNSLCANWHVLCCPEMETPENCRRLVMFQYLRQYHRPVWRILERQPFLLALLHRVINDSPDPLSHLPKSIDMDDLRMTREIFSRSFAHVLKHNNADDMKQHRSQTLDIAAERALERLDRNRSDNYFVAWARQSLEANAELNSMYLQITATFILTDD